MSEEDGMAEVTEADRERAAVVLSDLLGVGPDEFTPQDREWRNVVARALAGEREKARVQFCALLAAVSPKLIDHAGDLRGYLVSVPLLDALGITSEDVGHAAEEG